MISRYLMFIAHYIVLMALDFADGKTLGCFRLHEVGSAG